MSAESLKTLSVFTGLKINLLAYTGDPEIFGIANDISDAIGKPVPAGAGWQIRGVPGQEFNRAVKGILIEVKPDANLDAAKALASALREAHLAVAGPSPINTTINQITNGGLDPANLIQIVVGKKP